MTRALVALLVCAPLLARAADGPCRAQGTTVVCERAGFDALVHKLLVAEASAEKCVLGSEVRTAEARVLESRLELALAERDSARARVTVLEARPFPRTRMLGAVALGALAGVAVAVAVAPRVSSEAGAASLLTVSFTSAAAAVAVVLLE